MELRTLIPILTSLILGIITNAIYDSLLLILPVGNTSLFSIKGIWLSSFHPQVGQYGHSIELIKMHQRGNTVFFHLENYNSERSSITKLQGQGTINTSQLSAYYYHKDKANPDSGTFTLKIKGSKDGGTMLAGVYTEIIDKEGEMFPKPISQEMYMRKTKLPLMIQLRTLARKPYFENYQQAKEFFNV